MAVRCRDLCGVRVRGGKVRGACEGGRASGCLLMTTSMVPSPECGLEAECAGEQPAGRAGGLAPTSATRVFPTEVC
jgi:hypothetical protein